VFLIPSCSHCVSFELLKVSVSSELNDMVRFVGMDDDNPTSLMRVKALDKKSFSSTSSVMSESSSVINKGSNCGMLWFILNGPALGVLGGSRNGEETVDEVNEVDDAVADKVIVGEDVNNDK